MTIKHHISDGGGTNKRTHVVERQNENALVVATTPLTSYTFDVRYFTNSTYGSDINIDASPSGSGEQVHNGNDDVLWTGTVIATAISDVDFSSTDQAHTGTQSIDCTPTEAGDIFQLADTTEHALTDYSSFSGWIYVTSGWESPGDGVEIILWNTTTGIQTSSRTVDLDNYIDGGLTGSWQSFSISTADWGDSSDFDAMRFTILGEGGEPNFYLDDLQFNAEGDGTTEYNIRPSTGQTLYIDNFTVVMADVYAGTLADATMPYIPYNGFLGLPAVDNGFAIRLVQTEEIIFSSSYRQLSDILLFPHSRIEDYGSDGTSSWFKIFIEPVIPIKLHDIHDDYMSLVISDDFSPLSLFRVSAGCRLKVEEGEI